MNRPTPISVFSDQRRTKSTTWSRTSCGTQLPVRVPQVFFLARHARPSTRPGLHPWSAPSSPSTQSVSASPPPGGGGDPEPERQPLRSRRTPFASGKIPSASGSVLHTDPKLAPCPKGAASEPQPSLQQCSACALSSFPTEAGHLCVYMALQYLRTPYMRASLEGVYADLLDHLVRRGLKDPDRFAEQSGSVQKLGPAKAKQLANDTRRSYLRGRIGIEVKPELSLREMFEHCKEY